MQHSVLNMQNAMQRMQDEIEDLKNQVKKKDDTDDTASAASTSVANPESVTAAAPAAATATAVAAPATASAAAANLSRGDNYIQGWAGYQSIMPIVCDDPRPARLSKRPATLSEVWTEFKVGLHGNKPAEQFTMKERNADLSTKQKFQNRSKIWKVINRLIKSGCTAEEACGKIYQAYGHNMSVTNIVKGIIADERSGGHPDLR